MQVIIGYLLDNPIVALFLCLGIGCLLGKIRIGSFSFGATASTLIVAMALSLCATGDEKFVIDDVLRTVFFAMFIFTLGFEVGPSFFKALRSSGIKIVILSIVYAAVAGLLTLAVGRLIHLDTAQIVGLFAGAFTSTSAMGEAATDATKLAYTMTYFVGVIASIVYARYFIPFLLRVDLLQETRRKAARTGEPAEHTEQLGIVQVRAFRLLPDGMFVGKTVADMEAAVQHHAEVEVLYRGEESVQAVDDEPLCVDDVLTAVGDITALNRLDELGFAEVSEAKYFGVRQSEAQIVLTESADEAVYAALTSCGVLIREVERGGKRRRELTGVDLKKGDILHVSGPEQAIRKAVEKLGYIKDNGITTDIPFFALALMAGFIIGSISFMLLGAKLKLGSTLGTLIAGLVCGWLYDKYPRVGHITEGTRWFLKSIGLNLYIAVVGLTSKLMLSDLLSMENLKILLVGLVLALIARIPVMYFAKYVLKLDTVDLIGGMCGSGTNTPALNAVTEYTGSSLYAASFAPGYAVGNVAMIVTGMILATL